MIKWIDYIAVAVVALVYHPDKWLLLGMRTKNCRDEPDVRDNRWGGLKFGEMIIDGMKRELKEELWRDFQTEQLHSLGYREQFRDSDDTKSHWLAFYHLLVLRGDEIWINAEPDKRSEIRFFPVDALPPRDEVISMFYSTLEDFSSQIETITKKKVIF